MYVPEGEINELEVSQRRMDYCKARLADICTLVQGTVP